MLVLHLVCAGSNKRGGKGDDMPSLLTWPAESPEPQTKPISLWPQVAHAEGFLCHPVEPVLEMPCICLHIALTMVVQCLMGDSGRLMINLEAVLGLSKPSKLPARATGHSGEGPLTPLAFSQEKCDMYIFPGAPPWAVWGKQQQLTQWPQSQYLLQGSFGFQEDEDGVERNADHGGECHQPAYYVAPGWVHVGIVVFQGCVLDQGKQEDSLRSRKHRHSRSKRSSKASCKHWLGGNERDVLHELA